MKTQKQFMRSMKISRQLMHMVYDHDKSYINIGIGVMVISRHPNMVRPNQATSHTSQNKFPLASFSKTLEMLHEDFLFCTSMT